MGNNCVLRIISSNTQLVVVILELNILCDGGREASSWSFELYIRYLGIITHPLAGGGT
jgi:hypothetical protein